MSEYIKTKEYFLKLIASCVNETVAPEIPSDVNKQFLFKLASKNSAQVMLYYALLENREALGEEIFSKLEKSYKTAMLREFTQQNEIELLRNDYNAAEIDFMLLKGSHLKALYPKPEMRFMVDMDVLVRQKDVGRAEQVVVSHGLQLEFDNGKDIIYIKKPFLTIELHNSLFVEGYYMYESFTDVWEKAESNVGREYKMSLNDLYVYTMAHLAEHYTSGGSCFRPVIDIYLMNKKCSALLDRQYINSRLDELKLVEFSENIKKLGECWFEGSELTDNLKTMENYIVFGAPVKSTAAFAQATSEKKSKLSVVLSSAFPGLYHMKSVFPVLKKAPFLLPLFWVVRIFQHLFSKKSREKLERIKNVDNTEIENLQEIFRKSGILN